MSSCLWDDTYKRTLLLIGKSSPCGGSGFPLSLYKWFTICLIQPYEAAVMVEISILLICFCSFDLFCPLLDKDNSISPVNLVQM